MFPVFFFLLIKLVRLSKQINIQHVMWVLKMLILIILSKEIIKLYVLNITCRYRIKAIVQMKSHEAFLDKRSF